MNLLEHGIRNRVSAFREQRGLSASGLAAAVGISRQAMYAIEAGTYVPNTAVSLRLARELGVRVEELFALEPEPALAKRMAAAIVLEADTRISPGEPVQLCYVNERLVAIPALPTAHWLTAADGIAGETAARGKKLRIHMQTAEAPLRNRLLLSGCDPAMGVLARHAQKAGVDLLLVHQNSTESLAALKRGDVHIAGTHLRRSGASDPNLSTIALTFPKGSVAVISFALWQEGLVTAPGNPKALLGVQDLARRGVRFINREPGAGCRALLETQLSRIGLRPTRIDGYERVEHGHLAAARHVKTGSADCCIATEAAARVFGLGFVPIEEARYDLVLRKDDLASQPVQKLFDNISHLSFRHELTAASGYETRVTGERIL